MVKINIIIFIGVNNITLFQFMRQHIYEIASFKLLDINNNRL